jgi:hypothetical protein
MTPIDDAHRGAARGGGTFRLPGRFGRLDASDDDAGRAAARGDSGGWMCEGGAGERRRRSPASWFGCLGA